MDDSKRDVEMNIEPGRKTEQPTSLDFLKIVRSLLLIRNWLVHTRESMHKNTEGDDNIRKVFEPLSATTSTNDVLNESLLRKVWSWSFDETGLFFYLWTFLVFIGCYYNLVMIIVMVFEEIHKAFYHPWVILNIFFDTIFFIDLLVMTRKEFIEDGVKTTGVKDMLFHRLKT
uniref:Ion_trans domain-containing protein n=1 Tax=Heterorhabditis bacteriophora TaxID=37862 RepID=A0A1I7WWP6_HETBA